MSPIGGQGGPPPHIGEGIKNKRREGGSGQSILIQQSKDTKPGTPSSKKNAVFEMVLLHKKKKTTVKTLPNKIKM